MLSVPLLDRRQLVEVSLDARGELLRLRAEQLELALAASAFAAPSRLVPEASGEARPLGSDHCSNSAGEQGDHQPAHSRILAGP